MLLLAVFRAASRCFLRLICVGALPTACNRAKATFAVWCFFPGCFRSINRNHLRKSFFSRCYSVFRSVFRVVSFLCVRMGTKAVFFLWQTPSVSSAVCRLPCSLASCAAGLVLPPLLRLFFLQSRNKPRFFRFDGFLFFPCPSAHETRGKSHTRQIWRQIGRFFGFACLCVFLMPGFLVFPAFQTPKKEPRQSKKNANGCDALPNGCAFLLATLVAFL